VLSVERTNASAMEERLKVHAKKRIHCMKKKLEALAKESENRGEEDEFLYGTDR